MTDKSVIGKECVINYFGDVYADADSRPFLGQKCIILKKTKAGLTQVALKADPKKKFSFNNRNISIGGELMKSKPLICCDCKKQIQQAVRTVENNKPVNRCLNCSKKRKKDG
jgi:hypothetical protein